MTFSFKQGAVLSYLFLVLIMGGASAAGYGANVILQLGGAALIAWTLWEEHPGKGVSTGLFWFLTILGIVAALQFLPLPPAIWQSLPGREEVSNGFRLAGMQPPWLTLSLDPWGSLQSLVWWIPAAALFFSMRSSKAPSSRHVIWLIAGIAYVSVVLALVQTYSSSGYIYTFTNRDRGVGFFANANHLGTFFLMTMALLAGNWALDRDRRRRSKANFPAGYFLVAQLFPLAVGVIVSNSLACMLLMIPLLMGIYLLARPAVRIRWMVVAVVAAIFSFGLNWLLASGLIENDLMGKADVAGISRKDFLANGLEMLRHFAPLGSGLGTFREIYPWYENPAIISTRYANHAHNDLLELMIETGLLGLALIAIFAAWYTAKAWQLWNSDRTRNPIALAAPLAITVVLAHSLVDYPLRTAAISGLVAICCIFMARKPEPKPEAVGSRRDYRDDLTMI